MSGNNLFKLILPALLLASACTRVDSITVPTSARTTDGVTLSGGSGNLTTGTVAAPAGLKACFAGETNALDVVSNNVGALNGGVSFSAGKFGQAFDFHSLSDGVSIPASASLNVGGGTGMTMAAWIFPRGSMFGGAAGAGPIMEFEGGAHIWQHNQQGDELGLFVNMAEGTSEAGWHILQIPGVVTWNSWQHVAATYNKASGTITLYVNGSVIGTRVDGAFNPFTNAPLHIGQRVVPFVGAAQYAFNGVLDELQLYNRALTPAEVAQLASATGTMCVAPAVSYQVIQMPVGSGESGVPFTVQPVVVLLDASGNIVSNSSAPVTATASAGGTLLGTTTVNAVNGIATFTNLALAGNATSSLTFSAGALPVSGGPATSAPLTTVQVARQLGMTTQPGGVQSGVPLNPQPVVQVRDAAGLPMPGATNVITASVASGAGTLAGTTTVSAINASAAFSGLIVNGGGAVTLGFSSPGLTGVISNVFVVAPLPPSALAVLTQPGGAESGRPFAKQPVVEVRDATGARATAATGTVTATISSGAGGTIAGTVTAPIVNGLATFSSLQINGPGTFTLRFASGALSAATSAGFPVVQVLRQLVLISAPASIVSGAVISPSFAAELRDGAGIKIPTATNLIRISATYAGGALIGANEVNAVGGVVTWPNLIAMATGPTAQFYIALIDQGETYGSVFTASNLIPVTANNTQPFAWKGFLNPVDDLPKTNGVEAGQSIPVKFSIGGNFGLNILVSGSPVSQPASCADFSPTGAAVPILVTNGASDPLHPELALAYQGNKYQIVWKTDKRWEGTCRLLTLKLTDGTSHSARFKFKD